MKSQIYLNYKISLIFLFVMQVLFAQNSNWNQDLEVYYNTLSEKHINIFNKVNKDLFESELEQIKIESKTTNDFTTIIKLMKLTRKIGDGHTSVSLRNLDIHKFPFEINYIENKWRVVKVAKDYQHILKATLVAVDGMPIKEVTNKVSEVAQFVENKHSKVVRTGEYLVLSELLYALKITKEKQTATFTFEDENKNKFNFLLNALNKETYKNQDNFTEIAIGVNEISKPKNTKFNYLWYAPIKDSDAVYIKFKSYPSFDEMQLFGEELLNYISENSISKIVIDLRGNGGGDFYVGIGLAYALNLADSIDWENGVYVLCDNITFSAGTTNTALFKELLNAKVVGEPTGSNPTGYQDMDQFTLPNSKLVITYSKRYFNISEEITEGVQPDIFVVSNWNDYSKGIDTILNWVINELKSK